MCIRDRDTKRASSGVSGENRLSVRLFVFSDVSVDGRGAVVDISGKVQKLVKREGQCKLVIEPGASVPGFIVFADCRTDEKAVISRKIRKGSFVSIRGKFQTFGASAVCLSDCRLR